jgi:2-C-methyl-D-erythritol 4-phosphate cytidylyltransferase
MAVALIVAAGRGERLGSGRPKALVTVAGHPMLHWSVAALRRVAEVEQIIVALPADSLDAAPPGTVAVAGGEVRSQSVAAALRAAGSAGDPVIVHDAARPLVTPELFENALSELESSGADAVVAAAPVTDTIKQARRGTLQVERTLERSRLWAVQTPQVFRRQMLERHVVGASAQLLAEATDDAWLIEQAGGSVMILPAPAHNLKITTPHDLRVAELLLAQRGDLA